MSSFIPAALKTCTHWRASKSVGLKRAGDSFPSPHSRSVNVFMPKCAKAMNSRACQASWFGEGDDAGRLVRRCASSGSPGAMVTYRTDAGAAAAPDARRSRRAAAARRHGGDERDSAGHRDKAAARADRVHAYCPATQPDDQAHWKLYPPSHPVTSTTSPMKYRPGTSRASIVCEDSAVCVDAAERDLGFREPERAGRHQRPGVERAGDLLAAPRTSTRRSGLSSRAGRTIRARGGGGAPRPTGSGGRPGCRRAPRARPGRRVPAADRVRPARASLRRRTETASSSKSGGWPGPTALGASPARARRIAAPGVPPRSARPTRSATPARGARAAISSGRARAGTRAGRGATTGMPNCSATA